LPRYLTKSRFSTALECPTKLYYADKPDVYADTSVDNDFLKALADGGFQVGALARCYYPEGVFVEERDPAEALARTAQLMEADNVTLFEAAFRFGDLFIRTDIVVKRGNVLDLYEVKAKSFAAGKDDFVGKKGWVLGKWQPYLYDVAFQQYVLTHALPGMTVHAHLTLVNKAQVATVDGLNQRFFVGEDEQGRRKVVVKGLHDPASLGENLLITQNVDAIVASIHNGTDQANSVPGAFRQNIRLWAEAYAGDRKIQHPIGGHCGQCTFQADEAQKQNGLRSGFEECWAEQAGFVPTDFAKPSVLGIWRYPAKSKSDAIAAGHYFQEQLDPATFTAKKAGTTPGWTNAERQALQVRVSRDRDSSHRLNRPVLDAYLAQWTFPLHFIDFETTAVALPFHRGRRPYEQIAFQFSHHVVEADGRVRHAGQWIDTTPGVFPNFAFVRALKQQLEHDTGTIFRYAAHENTILNKIIEQLATSTDPDRAELIAWLQTITNSTGDHPSPWQGKRTMVDLLDVLLQCYYHPATNGSNSLKHVLPAVVNTSAYLQDKYGQPNYGTDELPSLNFSRHQWLHRDPNTGLITNPYKTLPLIHAGVDNESLDDLVLDESMGIADGGAAMTAYARMQFTEMGEGERQRITGALLRYCELDTLAMVMLYEAWREWCG
jgi:hypothetical protein